MKILAFGSHYEKDNLAWEVAKSLKGVEVKLCSSPEDVLDVEGDVCILDVVKGLESVELLDIDELKTKKSVTAHDFDVGFFLKLTGKSIGIIGIPESGSIEKIRVDVENLLKK